MTTHSTPLFLLFFFNAPATTEIYTLSLHDALPILHLAHERRRGRERWLARVGARGGCHSVSPSWDDEQHRDQRNQDRKSTRLNSSHGYISYAVFCLKKKKKKKKYKNNTKKCNEEEQ